MRNSEDQYEEDIGAYLLGALEPDEHAAFEKHLQTCEACREEVVRLEVARDALPRSVDQVAPPDHLKQSLMSAVRAEAPVAPVAEPVEAPARPGRDRGRWSRWRERLVARPAFAAGAAAVLLAVGIGVGAVVGALGGGDGEGSRTVAATVDVTRLPSGSAFLVVPGDADRNGGAILRVKDMQQAGSGQVYEVWLKRGDKVSPASLFNVKRDGTGAAAIPDGLEGVDAVLVTREPARGSTTPSEPPIVTVPLRS